ncbi:hypothetical protein [Pseudomonas ovata]|uniref:hypothetical protein n=1 Tax=Pseudomonas ovata TaxID=1839709 RepID=UPI000D68E8CB|nr:hypothetical protein [Pseudomonas ovata]
MSPFKEMDVESRRQYIANCELESCPPPSALFVQDAPVTTDELAKGVVVDSNLLAFTPGTSAEVIEDVNDCMLFATLVANKAFNPEQQNTEWFAKYNEVLSFLGWAPAELKYYQAGNESQTLSMDRIVLDMLKTALLAATLPGPTSAIMIGTATRMIDRLRTSDQPLRLFERQSKHQQGANFRVGACDESDDGVVNMVVSSVNFRSSSQAVNVLFVSWGRGEAEVYGASYNLRFNRRHYESVQADVRRKLTADARRNIEAFDI